MTNHIHAALFESASGPLRQWLAGHPIDEVVQRVLQEFAPEFRRNKDRIIIIQMGLGRDSIAMLLLLLEGKLIAEGIPLRPADVDAVVFSDPGYEWPETYKLIPSVDAICRQMCIPFFVLAKPPEEGPGGWSAWTKNWQLSKTEEDMDRPDKPWLQDLPPLPVRPPMPVPVPANASRKKPKQPAPALPAETGRLHPEEVAILQARAQVGGYHTRPPIVADYEARTRPIQKADASCTVNHKIGPSRRIMNDISMVRFGLTNAQWSAQVKKGTRKPHIFLLGIAADEQDRVKNLNSPDCQVGYSVMQFPLVEAGITRNAEAPILNRHGLGGVQKSGCMMCKFQGPDWFWALSVTDPAAWKRVLAWEKANLISAAKAGRSLSDARIVRGKRGLEDVVAEWRAEHPDATIDAVFRNEYRSCKSRYSEGQTEGQTEGQAVNKGKKKKNNPSDYCRFCGKIR